MRGLVFVVGAFVVAGTLGSAVRTIILPRGVPARIARRVFIAMRILFRLRAGRNATYERADSVMALYAPVSLLALLATWLGLVLGGYTLMFWGLGASSWRAALVASGSSLYTLGFERPDDLPSVVLAFTEAAVGLTLLALLIAYLPSIYSVFSRREAAVASMEVRANTPPSAVEMLQRFWAIGYIDRLPELFRTWEQWFIELGETHTSFPSLPFFRSPIPEHSWVTTAGVVLDTAALSVSTVDCQRSPDTELCIRAGYVSLRRIAAYFGIPFDPDPKPDDPISISRDEFDAVCDRLAAAGVPLRSDRDQAWRDFAGWRVNYDTVLVALAQLTMAPEGMWSTDRIALLGDSVARPRLQRRWRPRVK